MWKWEGRVSSNSEWHIRSLLCEEFSQKKIYWRSFTEKSTWHTNFGHYERNAMLSSSIRIMVWVANDNVGCKHALYTIGPPSADERHKTVSGYSISGRRTIFQISKILLKSCSFLFANLSLSSFRLNWSALWLHSLWIHLRSHCSCTCAIQVVLHWAVPFAFQMRFRWISNLSFTLIKCSGPLWLELLRREKWLFKSPF